MRTEEKVALPVGLNTGCVSSMNVTCELEHVPPATRLHPMMWESMAYFTLDVFGIFGIVVMPER
jgi:hypothetical protein